MRPPPAWLIALALAALLVAASGASAGAPPGHGRSSLSKSRESCTSRCSSRFRGEAQQRACFRQCSASVYTGMAYLSGRMRLNQESCYRALVMPSDRSLCRDRIDRKRFLMPRY